jgi:hypothetical protein
LTILVIGCNLITNNAFADDDPGFPGNDPGAPVAAIDSWVLQALLIGLVLSFLFFKKYKKKVIK